MIRSGNIHPKHPNIQCEYSIQTCPLKVQLFIASLSIREHVPQERPGLVWVDQVKTKKNGGTKKYFVAPYFLVFVMFSSSTGGSKEATNNVVNSHYSSFVSPQFDFLQLQTEKLSSTHKNFEHVQSRWESMRAHESLRPNGIRLLSTIMLSSTIITVWSRLYNYRQGKVGVEQFKKS